MSQLVTPRNASIVLILTTVPGYAIAEFQMAFALLFDGQYAEGLKYFEARFAARLPNFLLYPYPKWKGENGKTLFLVADQGLGDAAEGADRDPAGRQARERVDVLDEILAGHQPRACGRGGLGVYTPSSISSCFASLVISRVCGSSVCQQVASQSITRRSRAATSR